MPIDSFKKLTFENGNYVARELWVGVFVKGEGGFPETPNHVGLIYVNGEKKTRYLEYYGKVKDGELVSANRNDNPKQFFHAPMPIDVANGKYLASLLSEVMGRGWSIRYALNWLDGLQSFTLMTDSDGSDTLHYKFGPEDAGLSCATFVSELLDSVGLSPVSFDSWPINDAADLAYRNRRLDRYQATESISAERIKAIGSAERFVRLRPEQIAAAATREPMDDWPLDFDEVNCLAEKLVSEFQKAFAASRGDVPSTRHA
jgi:hypothetical protein